MLRTRGHQKDTHNVIQENILPVQRTARRKKLLLQWVSQDWLHGAQPCWALSLISIYTKLLDMLKTQWDIQDVPLSHISLFFFPLNLCQLNILVVKAANFFSQEHINVLFYLFCSGSDIDHSILFFFSLLLFRSKFSFPFPVGFSIFLYSGHNTAIQTRSSTRDGTHSGGAGWGTLMGYIHKRKWMDNSYESMSRF